MWRFVVDDDMPRSTAPALRQAGWPAEDVRDVGLAGHEDGNVSGGLDRGLEPRLSGDEGYDREAMVGWRDILRPVLIPYKYPPRPPGAFCGPPPRGSVRQREKIGVKSGDACTACGQALQPIATLGHDARVEGAGWWCAWCGMQFREGER